MSLRGFLIGLGVLTLIASCVWAGLWFWREWRFERYLEGVAAEMRSEGLPVGISELIPTEPLPENNAASLIFDAVAAWEDFQEEDPEAARKIELRPSEWNALIADNAELASVSEILSRPGVDRMLNFLSEAQSRESMWVKRDYSKTWTMGIQPVGDLLALAKVIGVRSRVSMAFGKWERAFEDVFLLFRLADFAQSDPILISYLAGLSINRIALSLVHDALAIPQADLVDEEELARLNVEVSRRKDQIFPLMIRALDGERLIGGELFRRLRSNKEALPRLLSSMGGQDESSSGFWTRDGWMGFLYQYPMRFFLDADQRAFMDFHRSLRGQLGKLAGGRHPFAGKQSGGKEDIPRMALLTRLSAPAMAGIELRAEEAYTVCKLAILGLLCAEYRLMKGSLPEGPDELREAMPEVDPHVGIDPYLLRDFDWESTREGLTIASGMVEVPSIAKLKDRKALLIWRIPAARSPDKSQDVPE